MGFWHGWLACPLAAAAHGWASRFPGAQERRPDPASI